MYNNVTIIGIGTLGGFLSNAIVNLETIKELTIIDSDIVEPHNIKNSIYRKKDIGKPKTECLCEILKQNNEDVKINKLNLNFIESEMDVPESDLVIDCRDFTYDRGVKIDIRLYLSSRYIIVDCRNNIKYKDHQEGGYLTELTKNDLRNATFIISMLIHNGEVSSLIGSKGVRKFDLDYLKKNKKQPKDIICDEYNTNENKFVNLTENVHPILEMNKEKDLNLYVGSETFPIHSQVVPKGYYKTPSDVVINLTSFVNLPLAFNNYIISSYNRGGKSYVELIPETGAA